LKPLGILNLISRHGVSNWIKNNFSITTTLFSQKILHLSHSLAFSLPERHYVTFGLCYCKSVCHDCHL